MKNLNRRKFIENLGLAAFAPVLLNACKSTSSSETTDIANTDLGINKFGLQLWSVKDALLVNAKQTLVSLGKYGYQQIESFQGDQGVFWGMQPKEFSSYLGDNGMSIISSHTKPDYALKPELLDEFKKLADDAASIGMSHLINPYLGFLKTNDEFKKATEGFNILGEACKERGLKYAYHNHHYSFTENEGVFPQDIMMEGTDPDLVDFEMDIYWVVAAKQDPEAWLKKYPNRFKLCHIKDLYSDSKLAEVTKGEEINPDFPINGSCLIGEGKIDFAKILSTAKSLGMQDFIVEQERYDGITSLNAAKANATYMKNFKLKSIA